MSILGDDIAHALPEMREHAESLMVDTCRITRSGEGEPVFNPETGQYEKRARVTVYGPELEPHMGRCRIQDNRVQVGAPDQSSQAGLVISVQNTELQLPVDGTGHIAPGDIAEILSCRFDPSLVGHQVTIEGPHGKSQATARRLRVKEGAA